MVEHFHSRQTSEKELEIGANLEETGNKSSLAPPVSGADTAWSNKEKEVTSVTISQDDKASVSAAHGKTSPSDSHHRSAVTKEPSSSAAAKAELDALLDSLGEIELSGSSGIGSQLSTNSAHLAKPHITSTNLDSLPPTNSLSIMNRGKKSSDVDDTIDDLLSEGRHFIPSYSSETKSNIEALRGGTFAEADSVSTRIFPGMPSFDDSIDDLLADTSSFSIQKSSMLQRVRTQQGMKESGASAIPDTLSKALDDLDSLLDL